MINVKKINHLNNKHLIYFIVPDTTESVNDSTIISTGNGTADNGSNLPVIRKKERDYEGMFEFRREDINVIIRHLVIGKFN